jgi:hypothetical protein
MHSQANQFKIQKHERINFHNAIIVMSLTFAFIVGSGNGFLAMIASTDEC